MKSFKKTTSSDKQDERNLVSPALRAGIHQSRNKYGQCIERGSKGGGKGQTEINKKLISQFPTGNGDGSANFADNLTAVLGRSQDLC